MPVLLEAPQRRAGGGEVKREITEFAIVFAYGLGVFSGLAVLLLWRVS